MIFSKATHTLFLLEEDGDRRAYIRQCLAAIAQVKRVHLYQVVERALDELDTYRPGIIVFSAEIFDGMHPSQMEALRHPSSKAPVAIVVTLPFDQRFGEDLAGKMVKGADAFFVEPFISHEMAQVIDLLSGDEIAPPEKRVRATLSHLVSRLRGVIDSLAYELLAHGRPGRARVEVKNSPMQLKRSRLSITTPSLSCWTGSLKTLRYSETINRCSRSESEMRRFKRS